MPATEKSNGPEILFFSLIFLFFFQLITDFIGAVYAFGLLGLEIPPELASVALLLAPLALVLFRRGLNGRQVAALAAAAIALRLVEPLLPTRFRMLASGLGAASLLVFFPALLSNRERERRDSITLGLGLACGVGLAVLARAAGSGADLTTRGATQVVGWLCGALALSLLFSTPGPRMLGPAVPARSHGAPAVRFTFLRVLGLAFGFVSALALLYLAFTAPNVIARWAPAQASYVLVVVLAALGTVITALLFAGRSRMLADLTPGKVLGWNVLFILALGLAVWLHQPAFPAGAAAYPFFPPAPAGWEVLALYAAVLLLPVIFVDVILLAQEITRLRPSLPALGGAFGLAGLWLLILVLAQVFTTVYDYIPVVGPLWRDRYWLVYVLAGVGLALPLLLVDRKCFDLAPAARKLHQPRQLLGFVILLALAAGGSAALTGSRLPAASPAAQAPQSAAPAPAEDRLKVLTYNIQQGYDAHSQKNLGSLLALLRREAPEVIGLQESDTNRLSGSNDDAVRFLADGLGMDSYYGPPVTAGTFGVALLSKYPIANARTFYMFSEGEQTAAILAEITKGGQTFTVLVTHLGNGGPLVQQQAVLQTLQGKQQVIAMGDFNFRPGSEQYQATTAVLQDAWLARWPSGADDEGNAPARRIDHFFVSPGMQVLEAYYLNGPESDHPAGVIEVGWEQP